MVHWQLKPSVKNSCLVHLPSPSLQDNRYPLDSCFTHRKGCQDTSFDDCDCWSFVAFVFMCSASICSEYFISSGFKSHLEFSVGLKMSPTLLRQPFLSSLVSLLTSLWFVLTLSDLQIRGYCLSNTDHTFNATKCWEKVIHQL